MSLSNFVLENVVMSITIFIILVYAIASLIEIKLNQYILRLDQIDIDKIIHTTVRDENGNILSHQKVKLYNELDIQVIQSIQIRKQDPTWLIITHNDQKLTISIENWNQLIQLTNSVIK